MSMKHIHLSPLAHTRRIAAVVTIAVLGVSACSSDPSAQEAEPATSSGIEADAGGATITILDFDFGEPLVVDAGTVVQIVNEDGAGHTVTADDGSFDTGVVAGGDSTELVLDEAGEFAFFCSIHTSMTGTVTVNG